MSLQFKYKQNKCFLKHQDTVFVNLQIHLYNIHQKKLKKNVNLKIIKILKLILICHWKSIKIWYLISKLHQSKKKIYNILKQKKLWKKEIAHLKIIMLKSLNFLFDLINLNFIMIYLLFSKFLIFLYFIYL